jgi:hypothetical protein
MTTENRFGFRLDKSFHKELRRKALEEDVSLAEVARSLLRLWLEGKIEVPNVSTDSDKGGQFEQSD